MPPLLSCQNLSKSFGAAPLFEGITIAVQDDDRLGLIGPNGSGKSTLLKIFAGLETADAGERAVSKGIRLAYLPQADRFEPGISALRAIIDAQQDLPLEAFEKEAEARALLAKAGFPDPEQSVDTFSGGWRKRLAIVRELVKKPDLLLLDEPTNHLDVEGILWLEEYLNSSRQAFVVITHDRYFLENVTRRIVELDRKYPQGYFSVAGNYSEFLTRREEFFTSQASYQESLSNKVRKEIEWLRRKAPARTRKSQARIDEAGRMKDELAEMKSRGNLQNAPRIDFSGSQRKTKELVALEGISKSRGGRTLFRDLTVTLTPGTRLGLLGPNGSGKTSLLRLVTGEDAADAGTVRTAEDLQMVLFDQNRQQLDKAATLRQVLAPAGGEGVIYRGQSLHIAAWAKRFLFRAEQLDRKVGTFSGGEQARMLIARLMLTPADILLLDEPTNDLDIPTLELLEESLLEFPGALVLVTHDRYLLDRVSTMVLGLDGEGGSGFFADFAQWRAAEEERESARKQVQETEKASAEPKRAAAPKPKKLTYAEQLEFDKMEETILQAETSLAACQEKLNDPSNASNASLLQALAADVTKAQQEVDRLYARWAELEEKSKPA
jgi:ATP-binding cassette subfamily F protein uup